jgi:anaerobic ribonucleoside-triphosphate reductase activating protein
MITTTPTLIVPIAHFVPCTEAEGPGKRFALWFQGCPLRCPGCCNPEMLPFEGGTLTPLSEILERIIAVQDEQGIEGITLLGGEPLAHARAGAEIAKAAHERGLSVMVFSGYTLAEARELSDPAVAELLALTDILVDGRYERELPDTERRWIGSTNQRIHFLTERYQAGDPCWKKKNTLEIRLDANGLALNGFPAQIAVGLWKELPRKSKTE